MPTGQKILLVDDDEDILEFLGYNLAREGYEVKKTTNGLEAIEIALKILPDLIILDVMMPGMDGIETCRHIRENERLKGSRIAFLTARGEDYSQIAGFDAGGDDYIIKPINPKVFVSRVKALLNRTTSKLPELTATLVFEDLRIDRENYMVYKDGEGIELPRKEFELLYLFASKPNKVFTRQEIFEKIWGENIFVGMRTIDVHIRKLRTKVDIPNIKTVKGIGYKFESR